MSSKLGSRNGKDVVYVDGLEGGNGFEVNATRLGDYEEVRREILRRNLTPPSMRDLTLIFEGLIEQGLHDPILGNDYHYYEMFGFDRCFSFGEEAIYIVNDVVPFPFEKRHKAALSRMHLSGDRKVRFVPYDFDYFGGKPMNSLHSNVFLQQLIGGDMIEKAVNIARKPFFKSRGTVLVGWPRSFYPALTSVDSQIPLELEETEGTCFYSFNPLEDDDCREHMHFSMHCDWMKSDGQSGFSFGIFK